MRAVKLKTRTTEDADGAVGAPQAEAYERAGKATSGGQTEEDAVTDNPCVGDVAGEEAHLGAIKLAGRDTPLWSLSSTIFRLRAT